MPTYGVIGIEKIDFTDREGRSVRGGRIHLTYEKKNVVGSACDSVFVPNELAEGLEVGMLVNLLYNKYGKVVQIDSVS